ncbi:hypothetical protein FOMPIDRAFT_1055459 [Fomitopsis schrenkii]|uniref:Uncharacterized protein n=1 Tax=Fomitopsis schrenkii TaxID=2126942 RepID=S8DKA6_FOMSC|nr:hypothetical protein FOMPIDRAFT_1055459 [Fomitopsis schrenkii]
MTSPVSQWSYLYTFSYIATDWDLTNLNYSTAHSPSWTPFSLLWGAIVAIVGGSMGYKWSFVFGLALRILARPPADVAVSTAAVVLFARVEPIALGTLVMCSTLPPSLFLPPAITLATPVFPSIEHSGPTMLLPLLFGIFLYRLDLSQCYPPVPPGVEIRFAGVAEDCHYRGYHYSGQDPIEFIENDPEAWDFGVDYDWLDSDLEKVETALLIVRLSGGRYVLIFPPNASHVPHRIMHLSGWTMFRHGWFAATVVWTHIDGNAIHIYQATFSSRQKNDLLAVCFDENMVAPPPEADNEFSDDLAQHEIAQVSRHIMCRLCANELVTAASNCPFRCSPNPVQHNDILPMVFTFEQPGNVATADELIARRTNALREEILQCDQTRDGVVAGISIFQNRIIEQCQSIDENVQELARIKTTLSLKRSRVDALLQQCHFELNQISALESRVRLFVL